MGPTTKNLPTLTSHSCCDTCTDGTVTATVAGLAKSVSCPLSLDGTFATFLFFFSCHFHKEVGAQRAVGRREKEPCGCTVFAKCHLLPDALSSRASCCTSQRNAPPGNKAHCEPEAAEGGRATHSLEPLCVCALSHSHSHTRTDTTFFNRNPTDDRVTVQCLLGAHSIRPTNTQPTQNTEYRMHQSTDRDREAEEEE